MYLCVCMYFVYMYVYKYICVYKYVYICITCICAYIYAVSLLKIIQSYYRNENNRQAKEKVKIIHGSTIHS